MNIIPNAQQKRARTIALMAAGSTALTLIGGASYSHSSEASAVAPTAAAANTVVGDPTAPFYRQTVYAIGFASGTPCQSMEGLPAGLWGNQEKVNETDRVSQSGRILTITGKHEDGSTTAFGFFLRRDECAAAAKTAGLEIDPAKNAARSVPPQANPSESGDTNRPDTANGVIRRDWLWSDAVAKPAGGWFVSDSKSMTCAPIDPSTMRGGENTYLAAHSISDRSLSKAGNAMLFLLAPNGDWLKAYTSKAECGSGTVAMREKTHAPAAEIAPVNPNGAN